MLRGWRDEPFAIRPSFAAPARAVVERAAAPLLGAPAYGVFCTAYVQDDSGAPAEVWLGRRSKSKPTWPGLLDSVAAGGLAAGELPRDAMAAECQEEAGVAEDLLHGLKPVGAVSYTGFHQDRDWAVKPDTLFCFDLAVPRDWAPTGFKPCNNSSATPASSWHSAAMASRGSSPAARPPAATLSNKPGHVGLLFERRPSQTSAGAPLASCT